MASEVVPVTEAVGLNLYWFPLSEADFTNWATKRVQAVDTGGVGKYVATLTDTDSAYWGLFETDGVPTAPTNFAAAIREWKVIPQISQTEIDNIALAASQTAPTAIRSSVGLESANLKHLVNAVVGKNVVTNNGDGTYDIAVRDAADTEDLTVFRYNPTTGSKVIIS